MTDKEFNQKIRENTFKSILLELDRFNLLERMLKETKDEQDLSLIKKELHKTLSSIQSI